MMSGVRLSLHFNANKILHWSEMSIVTNPPNHPIIYNSCKKLLTDQKCIFHESIR